MDRSILVEAFTTSEIAAALIVPRQNIVDVCRRSGFAPEGYAHGDFRMTFLDVVLLDIALRHAAFMGRTEACALAMALRPFAQQLATRYGAHAEDKLVKMGEDAPVAFAQRDTTGPHPAWKVFAFDTMGELAASLAQAAADPDRSAEATGQMIDMAHAIQRVFVALSRVGVLTEPGG